MKTLRFLNLLENIAKGKQICIEKYAAELDVNKRTLQRYIKEIEEYFGVKKITVKRGCYVFVQLKNIKNILIEKEDSADFEKFSNILNALNPKFLKYLGIDKKILTKIVSDDLIYIKESPVEELMKTHFFSKLKHAIKFSKIIKVVYKSDDFYIFENFKPYKIVFAEGNWYLCGMSDDDVNNGFKFLRINFITYIEDTSKTFKKEKKVLDFIISFQSLFSLYDKKPFEVILKINKKISRFFEVKKFLNSQTVISKSDDFLLLKYYVNNEKEIFMLVKKWLPDIKIVSPEPLKEKFEQMIQKYLSE
ncbi:helix-turn-helix transcriptional regulator [Nautilia sp.]